MLELIASLVLVGILATVAGLGFVEFSEAYLFTRDATALAQKANISMQRITRAVTNLTNIEEASNNKITILRFSKTGQVREEIYHSGDEIRIIFNDSADDTLVDNVSSFNINYRRFDGGEWSLSDPDDHISKLAFIDIEVGFTGPNGAVNDLTTTAIKVTPRNTFIPDGTMIPGGSSSMGRQFCFIETCGFGGEGGNEMGFLSGFSVGKIIIASVVLICLLVSFIGLKKWRIQLKTFLPKQFSSRKGITILFVIVTIIFVGAIGAGLISMLNSADVGISISTFAPKAYYMAESGINYAAYRYVNETGDKDDVIAEMHTQGKYTMDSGGAFELKFEPFWFNHNSGTVPAGMASFTSDTETFPAQVATSGTTGRLTGNKGVNSVTFTCNGISGDSLRLNLAGDLPVDSDGEVFLVAQTAYSAPLTDDMDLPVNVNDIQAFPPTRGVISISTNAGQIYAVYDKANYASGLLEGISHVPTAKAFSDYGTGKPAINNANLILTKFVKIESTGFYGPENIQAARTITYNQPLHLTDFYTKHVFEDNMDGGVGNWDNIIGERAAATIDGNGVLQVLQTEGMSYFAWNDSTNSNDEYVVSQEFAVGLDWNAAGLNLSTIWQNSQNTLSYDMQVKVRFNQGDDVTGASGDSIPATYMPGLAFRVNDDAGEGDTVKNYGLAFMRSVRGTHSSGGKYYDDDNIPDSLFNNHSANTSAWNPYNPTHGSALNCLDEDSFPWLNWDDIPVKDGRPYIVLWSRDVAKDSSGRWWWYKEWQEHYAEWVAYHPLCEETATTIFCYRNGTTYKWYSGTGGPGTYTGVSMTAIRLVDKSGALATTTVEGVTVLGSSGVPAAQVNSTDKIGYVYDPATNKPVAPVNGRAVGYIFPGSGESGAKSVSFLKTNNYRIYLKEWVTLMARVFELRDDFNCDGNKDDFVNVIQAYFASPDGEEGSFGVSKDSIRKPLPRGMIRWPEDGDYLTHVVYPANAFSSDTRDGSKWGCSSARVKFVERVNDGEWQNGAWTGDYVMAATDWYTTGHASGPGGFEIGLHSFGITAKNDGSKDKLYFDDFSLVVYELNTAGLIRGIQQ